MNKTLKKISSLVLVLLIIFSTMSMLVGCFKEPNEAETTLGVLITSKDSFVIGENEEIVFTVEVTGEIESVILHSEESNQEIEMRDDGSGVDKTASDGIFSCAVSNVAENAGTVTFYAKCGEKQTNSVIINCFVQHKETDKADVEIFEATIENFESQYVDENGYVDSTEVAAILDKVEEYAKQMIKDGTIISFERTESSVVVTFDFGLTSVYTPEIEGTYSGTEEREVSVLICQPEYDWVASFDSDDAMPNGMRQVELLENAGNDIVNMFEHATLTLYKNDEVSLNAISEFGKNQVILWQGHGAYAGKKIHSVVSTGQDFDWNAYYNDEKYREDCLNNLILSSKSGSEYFSYKYIEKYCSDLSGSIVYLGPCESGYDSVLADSFIAKGAEGVVANTKSILCVYGDLVQYTTAQLLTEINPNTNNYYTFGEALETAKARYGESDASFGGYGAVPTLFGGEKAAEYRLDNFEGIKATDFTVPEELVVTIGELSVIEPTIIPEDATEYSIAWTSSDPTVLSVSPTGEAGVISALKKGTVTVTAELTSGNKKITKTTTVRVASKSRDTVLVLDISGSMNGDPLTEMKKSAINFCTDLLKDEYNNRVGIVFYDDEVTVIELTNDVDYLVKSINAIRSGGRTNMYKGLVAADNMLKTDGKSDAIKNVVIMADGIPNEGPTSNSNLMPEIGYQYEYARSTANAVIDKAQEMMKSYNLYSLGFFHSLSGDSKIFGTALMKQLVVKEEDYYQVDKAEDLQFAFGDISDEISTGAKIVVNIACPVDVTVTYGDESLSSASDTYCDKASFGTLTLLGKDKDIKVLSLDADKEYNIDIKGTGEGKMDYSVNYFDESEQLIDYRSFESVPITQTTKITTETSNKAKDVELSIDNDGDGEVDTVWTAGEKSSGEITYEKNPPTPAPTATVEPTAMPTASPEPSNESEVSTGQIIATVVGVLALIVFVGVIISAAVISSNKGNNDDDEEAENYEIVVENKSASEQPVTEDNPDKLGMIKVTSGTMNGATVSLKDGETVYVGKDPRFANLVIAKEYKLVSRAHCTITYDAKNKRYYVVDSSTNGTYFNRTRLIKGKRTPINVNSVITLASDECTLYLG